MKKLKIDKIKLADLSMNEQDNVMGGDNTLEKGPSIIATISVSVVGFPYTSMDQKASCGNCITDKPGTQDSCGLCSHPSNCCPSYGCP